MPDMLLHAVKSVCPLHSVFSIKHFAIKNFLISPTYRLKTRVEKEGSVSLTNITSCYTEHFTSQHYFMQTVVSYF